MSEKKHIDRLFQEKLKNFEETPDDLVWDKIHDRLHEDKRSRKVIPLWWKLAGVAALLLLMLTVGMEFMSDDVNSENQNSIVDTEKQSEDNFNDIIPKDSDHSEEVNSQMNNSSEVVVENGNSEDSSNDLSSEASNNKSDQQQRKTSNSGYNTNSIVNNNKSNTESNRSQDNLYKDNLLNNSSKDNKNSNTKDAVANVSKSEELNSNQNNLDNKKETSELDKIINTGKNDNRSAVTSSSENKSQNSLEDTIEEEQKEEATKETSIEDAIAAANTEDEKEKEKESKLNRWSVSPNVAPVLFNSLGKGSALDEQFVDNNNSSEVTMSYGVGGSYAINDRLKVRAGINKVDMGYGTNNVIAFRNIDSTSRGRTKMSNVSTNGNAANMTYLSTETLDISSTPEIINSKSRGSINQRFGFIEVPLEIEYALVDKKLGFNVIGGFSTLIVDKNEIYSVVDGTETRIGEANNINNMSYSANFGLGINYNISEKIKVNVEPTFKYQINTFNNSSGDFQPYFIGVYTGLSYKF